METALRRFGSFWFYPAASILLIASGRELEPFGTFSGYFLWFLPGLASWTLIEYILHRFFFHSQVAHPALRRFFAGFHRAHHAQPREPLWILVRLRTSLPLSALLMGLIYALTRSWTVMTGMIVGIWAGFLYYEWVHYRVHTSSAVLGLDGQRRRHFRHHFVDDRGCFGVTSPFWDRAFGTYVKPSRFPGKSL